MRGGIVEEGGQCVVVVVEVEVGREPMSVVNLAGTEVVVIVCSAKEAKETVVTN